MRLSPSLPETLHRARADLRMGLPVVLAGTAGKGLLTGAVETMAPERTAALNASGAAYLALTARRAETLKARAYDDDLARILLPADLSPERLVAWLRALADPKDDLSTPLKGPFASLRDGDASLARLALGLAKTAQLLPAMLCVDLPDAPGFASDHDLTLLPARASTAELARETVLASVVSARLPMVASEAGRVHVFRPEDGSVEHYAIEIGRPDRAAPVLARVHSACFTGDVLGSLKCDCGPQLRAALAQMGAEGSGVLLYLNQEGRGIGLANKLRAYALQDQGFDTVEANHRLGFEDDERDFRIGAALLTRMGFGAVRLMTNNPAKVAMLQAQGLKVVERVPLTVGQTEHNATYLATKASKSGHLL